MKEYKSIFLDAERVANKSIFSIKSYLINGDTLARSIQATIAENTPNGFSLKSVTPIQSSESNGSGGVNSYTSGVILVFEKDADNI